MADIAAINLTELEDGDDVARRDLRSALSSTGFFILGDHGVPPDEVQRLSDVARQFYELDTAAKERVRLRSDFTGWVPFRTGRIATSQLNPDPVPDLYEAFLVKRGMQEDDSAWPDVLPELRLAALSVFQRMQALGFRLLPHLATALDVLPSFFDGFFEDGEMTLRLNLYPPVEDVPDAGYRMAPHVDSGFVTFLPGGALSSLEVLVDGLWHSLPDGDGWLAVNTGALLQRWSNQLVVASAHRVRAEPNAPFRCTSPFFFSPHRESVITPMPNGREPSAPPFRFGDFLDEFMKANLPDVPDDAA